MRLQCISLACFLIGIMCAGAESAGRCGGKVLTSLLHHSSAPAHAPIGCLIDRLCMDWVEGVGEVVSILCSD